jgi:hypothetical protein
MTASLVVAKLVFVTTEEASRSFGVQNLMPNTGWADQCNRGLRTGINPAST